MRKSSGKKGAKKNVRGEAAKVGRPPAYRPEYARQAELIARLGATDTQLAEVFGIAEATLNNWKHKYPEFLESLKGGKAVADDAVEQSLFKRACGYAHPEDKVFQYKGEPLIVPTTRHHPPDTGACVFWLKNRRPAGWRESVDVLSGGKPIVPTLHLPVIAEVVTDVTEGADNE